MANILKAVIDVSAPGAAAAFQVVALGSATAAKGLTTLQRQVVAFGGGVKTFVSGLTAARVPLNAISPSIDNATRSLARLPQVSNQAAMSMINLGRVVQDAPFGFLGIANNLNPLLESFQRLKTTTGTTGGALKALGSSLLGAGGLGFALSVVSSALIVFGDKLFGSATASKASESALESLGNTIDDVKNSVKELGDELQFLNQLGGINTKIFKLGDLSDLRQQSVAQAQFTQSLEEQKKKLESIGKQITANTELNGEDRAKAEKESADAITEINKNLTDSQEKQRIIYRQIQLQKNNDQEEANKKAKQLNKNFADDTIARAKELSSFLDKRGILNISAGFDVDPRRTKFENLDKAKEFIRKALSAEFSFIEIDRPALKIPDLSKSIEEAIDFSKFKDGPVIRLKVKMDLDEAAIRAEAQRNADAINSIIVQATAESFAAIGEAIGDALSGGDIGKGFKAFLGVLASGIQAIGKQIITLGTVALLAKKAIEKFILTQPALAIAAGVALVAVGAAMKNLISGGVKGFAGGGYTGSGGRNDPAGIVHKGEYVIPAFAVNKLGVGFLNNLAFGSNIRGFQTGGAVGSVAGLGGGTSHSVVFEISGQKLRGVLSLADASLKRLT